MTLSELLTYRLIRLVTGTHRFLPCATGSQEILTGTLWHSPPISLIHMNLLSGWKWLSVSYSHFVQESDYDAGKRLICLCDSTSYWSCGVLGHKLHATKNHTTRRSNMVQYRMILEKVHRLDFISKCSICATQCPNSAKCVGFHNIGSMTGSPYYVLFLSETGYLNLDIVQRINSRWSEQK